jgi:DNA-binding NtrC family response regulator
MPESDEGNRIHLVHDDSDVLLSLYEVLSAAGLLVAASTNTRDALSYIVRTKPRAVLCRWEMPEMDGGELLRRVRKASPLTRFVLSSHHADASMYEDVLRRGGDDLLREPLHPLAVVHVVSRLLGFTVPYPASDPESSPFHDASIEREG